MAKKIIEVFPRINPRLTRVALERLNYACEVRERAEPRVCPQGQIIVELIMAALPPSPTERAAGEKEADQKTALPRKRMKRAKRGAEAETMTA